MLELWFKKIFIRISDLKKIRSMIEVVIAVIFEKHVSVAHDDVEMMLIVPNKLMRFRASTFATKEPETLRWIDNFYQESILWDIGANVGLYSIYAAKRGHEVVAFEPSVFNLELLARHISINKVVEDVIICPIPLSEGAANGLMDIGNCEWGGALSCFEKGIDYEGGKLSPTVSYRMVGMSIDLAIEKLGLPKPDYLKIDVDGIEHFILEGAVSTLATVKGVLVEVNEDFQEQSAQVRTILESNNFTLVEMTHSEMYEASEKFSRTYNQIWLRKA